jgi:tetratricopeptide (TPR) repeat protein
MAGARTRVKQSAASRRQRWLLATALALLLAACNPPKPATTPVPQVDLSAYENSVRTGLQSAQATFDRVAAAKPTDAVLGAAYGELAMMYHAQDIIAPAEVAYKNAHALAPRDVRWPYLLAQLYADSSRLPEAIIWFEKVLTIDRDHAATLIALGQAYQQTGNLEAARKTFEHAKFIADARPAAAAGLGKVALAEQRYADAAKELEEAIRLFPRATRLYQPLAAAYRGLNDDAKAAQSAARYDIGGVDPAPPDTAADALADRVLASRVLLRRGQRAGKAGRFDLAAQAFRAAFAADPHNAEALANLGISVANLGKTREAQQLLERALAMDDSSALAHLSLAVVYDRQGLDDLAIAQYERTLKIEPDNLQVRIYLADARLRTNAPRAAIGLYQAALERSPDSARLQVSLAMAHVKAGDFRGARRVLEAAAAKSDDREVTNALARLLLTAPDKAVRAEQAGFAMAKALFERTRTPDVGQTYAMGFAATGRYDEAIKLQEETIIAYQRSGLPVDTGFLERNLAFYRQHRPVTAGWSLSDAQLNPRTPATQREK